MQIYNYKEHQIMCEDYSIFIPAINVRLTGDEDTPANFDEACKLIDIHQSKAFICTSTLGQQSLVSILINGELLIEKHYDDDTTDSCWTIKMSRESAKELLISLSLLLEDELNAQ